VKSLYAGAAEPALGIWMRRGARPDAVRISSVFQPIVDLIAGQPIGFEVLSRGEGEWQSPLKMFEAARQDGTTWELEAACREAALRRIGSLQDRKRGCLFFLNVSPQVIEDPRFVKPPALQPFRTHGVEPTRVVFEVTEHHSIGDHATFQGVVEHFGRLGFQFAADDFGAGHSSLISLIACTPRFIKLDREVVRELHKHPYKRNLVRSLAAFAASVDTRLIAEGVELWEELSTLLRLGVRYAQGYLLGRPAIEPEEIAGSVRAELKNLVRSTHAALGEVDEIVDSLVLEPVTVEPSMRIDKVEQLFRASPSLDHMVLVHGGRPYGLITREDFFARLGGRYGYALSQRKPAEQAAKQNPLSVSERAPVTTLATRAMDRAPKDLYDPVLVVDAQGALLGTVTMKALIRRSVELQVRSAQGASPLTGLPGNREIHKWIHGAGDSEALVLLYADLDRFKEYNDRYGFLMGDELIRLAARVLGRVVGAGPGVGKLGHVGGDDFVAVFPEGVSEELLIRACAEFDREKLLLFDPEDVQRGALAARTRRGELEEVPLVTLSVAVIHRAQIGGSLHSGMLSELAASLKRRVKQQTSHQRCSGFLFERRTLAASEP
jgi:EAL domain-containing protein (putative c-di-GMP-specific phosphodiesterase class I)/GGDEF domain-containing protein